MKKRDLVYLIVTGLLVAAFFVARPKRTVVIETRIDTLVVRDTIRDTVPVTVERLLVRTDTVWLRAAADTVMVEVEVPVERKIYETDDYRAVVEGFRPRLAEIEIYRNTLYIKESSVMSPRKQRERPRRWGIGVQAGYGLTPDGISPYVGVGIQYSLITW